jgi:hypothetical protein
MYEGLYTLKDRRRTGVRLCNRVVRRSGKTRPQQQQESWRKQAQGATKSRVRIRLHLDMRTRSLDVYSTWRAGVGPWEGIVEGAAIRAGPMEAVTQSRARLFGRDVTVPGRRLERCDPRTLGSAAIVPLRDNVPNVHPGGIWGTGHFAEEQWYGSENVWRQLYGRPGSDGRIVASEARVCSSCRVHRRMLA